MTAVGGGLGSDWQESQIALQHKILDRMHSLGMTPVFQGFAGFVPKAMKEHFPEINLTETKWSGLKSYMLSPLDSLFSVILHGWRPNKKCIKFTNIYRFLR